MTSDTGMTPVASIGAAAARTWLINLAGFALLLQLATDPCGAAEPERWQQGQGSGSADIDREVLWLDNPDFAELVGSSEVIGAYDF